MEFKLLLFVCLLAAYSAGLGIISSLDKHTSPSGGPRSPVVVAPEQWFMGQQMAKDTSSSDDKEISEPPTAETAVEFTFLEKNAPVTTTSKHQTKVRMIETTEILKPIPHRLLGSRRHAKKQRTLVLITAPTKGCRPRIPIGTDNTNLKGLRP